MKLKKKKSFGTSSKHCEKTRKCWLPALSFCPTMFSKGLLYRVNIDIKDGINSNSSQQISKILFWRY